MNYSLDIILPCYNPNEGFIDVLASTFTALQAKYPSIELHYIVSNDGSTKNFGTEVRDALTEAIPGTTIAGYERNKGKGAAVRAGLSV